MGLISHNSVSYLPHSLSWMVDGFQSLIKNCGNTQTHIPTRMPLVHSCPGAAMNDESPPALPHPLQQVLTLTVGS